MKQRIIGSYKKLKETNFISNFFNLSSIQISNILLLLITIRLITGVVGIPEFGIIMFANRVSQFASTIINYGTNQSAVRDTASNIHDKERLSIVFYNALWIKTILFVVFIILLLIAHSLPIPYYSYIWLATPIVLAEVFNPLCFFIGVERLRVFNIVNLVFNVIAVLALLYFIKGPADSGWINFILGSANAITYLGLFVYLIKKLKLSFRFPLKNQLLKIAKNNFYLTVNNVSVNLQQSVIIFALAEWSTVQVLGAYTLGDRVVGQCRNLLITISNAIYPNTVHVYKEGVELWNAYRRKFKYIIAGVFFAGSILLFILADFIVCPLLSEEHDAMAVLFLRIMAFVPAVSALNVLNVLDQLLKNNNVYIFRIAVILLLISLILVFVLLNIGDNRLIGAFTLIIECCALLMYEYVIKKPAIQNA